MRFTPVRAMLAALAVASVAVTMLPGGIRPAFAKECPPDMVSVGRFCIDRWEASTVDHATGHPLSPYYPPTPNLMRYTWSAWERLRHLTGDEAARRMPLPAISSWQRAHTFQPRAVSQARAVPQAYVSYHVARQACENAGKRLCKSEEWLMACRGRRQAPFPYGTQFHRESCNVYRYHHPAFVLHGASYLGHLDPRLNLLAISGDEPVLRLTGVTPTCASSWGEDAAYDMVGNLDEWVADEGGVFRGGFYARSTTKGCESSVASHSVNYYDYSTGFRCCR